MKVIIAGTRTFVIKDYELDAFMEAFPFRSPPTEIVSGHSGGVDMAGERYAKTNRLKLTVFPAEWEKYGRYAGPIRNSLMAWYADALLLIWDGESKGSASMLKEAKAEGLTIMDVRMRS